MKRILLIAFLPICFTFSQIQIKSGGEVTENFNTIGTSATASLPANWKVDKTSSTRIVGSYQSAVVNTERSSGDNMSSSAGNGIYNFGLGDASTASDRAIGGISSGSGSKSVNIYAYFQNTGQDTINQVDISYDVYRFRDGLNSEGFSIQLYYSSDGTNWNSAGTQFLSSFSPNSDNNGGTVPLETKNILNQTLSGLNILPNTDFYLAWNYSVTSGNTTSNAQALGIDNFKLNNIISGKVNNVPLAPKALAASSITDSSFTANWESSEGADNYFIDVSKDQGFTQLLSGYNNKNVGNITSYTVSGLNKYTQYYYRVRAGNIKGASDNSDTVSVKTSKRATIISFVGFADAVIKNLGEYNLTLSIINADSANATTCSVAYIADSSSATKSYINNFSSTEVTFPAGDTAREVVKIKINDNGIVEIPKKAFFKIENVSGGTTAHTGKDSVFTLSITSGVDSAYYSSIPTDITGDSLKHALNKLISSNVNEYPYTDNSSSSAIDVWKILKAADEDPKNPNDIIAIYSGLSIPKNPTTYWNREHVWSKSHGDFGTSRGAGTDAHHLRPENPIVNSLKGNLDFDNGGNPVPNAPGCFYDSDSWEPRDAVKGDVARMIFYMATRYEGHVVNSIQDPDLKVVDYIPSSPSNQPYYGKLSTLLQWNKQDPPDAFEMNRNNVVYYYQHNRNPYIDHPEWVSKIWGKSTQVADYNNMSLPANFELLQNYPNPFNPSTTIKYALASSVKVTISVYNTLGQQIKQLLNENETAGYHVVTFNASELSSGVYFYRITAGNFVAIRKMILLK